MERINKETGELSASGELASVSEELKGDGSVEGKEKEGVQRGSRLLQALREQLQDLGRRGPASSDRIHDERDPATHREERLLKVLPLYIQVCESDSRAEGVDLKGLAGLTADMVVSSIHSRLAARPAEEARYQVVDFFQRFDGQSDSEGTENPGWLLLKSLSLLTADNTTEDAVSWIKTGLPAALVKCLYLLVCLPAQQDNTAREDSFQQLLTQVLLQLCTQRASVEKMVETQELQCLIISLTSLWDQTSAPWRHQASRVLGAISAAQTRNTVPNLLDKNCVRICIQNLLRIGPDVPGPVLAEVALAVFGFVRDTYPINPALFAAFDANDGYAALESILRRCEAGVPADQFQPVEDLLRFIASLTLLGKAELKVALCISNPQPPGFKFDPPLIKGGGKAVVKNLPAFLLLHNSLVRSADPRLCCGVLGTLRSLWEWDQANFFLLEWTTQCLAQLAGCVWRKASSVHKLFFSLLEMVVFQLNYIPHETLRAVQSVLKQGLAGTLAGGGAGAEFGVTALSCYHRMTVRSGLVAEVLSDGGLLELLLGELRRRAKILRKAGVVPATRTGPQQEQSCVEASERAFTTCMLKVVAALTLRSIRNTVSVRDLGMVPYIKIFLDSEQYRGPALHILEQLAEINPEEFMSTAIGALCSSTPQEVALKHDLLQSVLKVLESPNSWDAFRRAGGFTGLLSLVVDMEGALSPRPPPQWGGGGGGTQWVLDLLLLALHILALAVHLHPVNAHQFQTGGFYERLAEALFQLGCFQMPPKDPQPLTGEEATPKKTPVGGDRDRPSSQGGRSFHQFVELAESTASVAPLSSSSSSPLGPSCTGPQPPPPPPPPLPPLPLSLRICVRLLSYLDQFATGTYATAAPELSFSGGGPGGSEEEEEEEERGDREREKPSGAAAAGREREEGGGADAGSSSVGRRADSTSDPQSVEDVQERSRNAAFSVSSVFSESRFTCDHTILHPGAVRVIMTLLPAVFTPDDPQLSIEVQFSVANHIQALVKSERNRQIMCGDEEGGGLVPTLLTHCKAMLLAPDHPLHLPVTRILEKLSSQAITQSELRRFLCLADPLMCSADKVDAGQEEDPSVRTTTPISNGTEADGSIEAGEGETTGGRGSSTVEKTLKRSFSLLRSPASSSSSSSSFSSLPLHQIISLVSMTAPRNFRPHRLSSSPAFVEFDMSESGYGCLVLPSLATVKGVNADSIPTGGVGGECRGFPPAAGLSYSCWFHINRFSSACDSHPIRLLSVVRHMSRAEHHYVCLSVSFSACDGCLVISTEEEPYTFLDMMEPEVSSSPSPLPASLRFRCSSMLVPGQWHHLAVVLAKDVKKSCRVSAYLNGRTVGTAKMRYIQPFPGQYVSMDPTAVIDVYALIGTPSLWKEHAALLWRVGPAYLLEESLSAEAVAAIYAQGTAYLGNFLSLRHTGHEADMVDPPLPARLVPEERISFGINPSVATVTTATQIREDYNEVDCRLIAKEMGITSRDNSTPVFLARNLSQHLSGTARTIGAALVGNYGVRTFTPKSAATGFLYLGGPAVTLALVAMAPDDSSLYAAMKVLVSVLETSPTMQQEMNRIHGYKLLSFLLKMKSVLVSSRTFQLVLYMCSSLELLSGPQCLPNTPAFQALLCNLEVWQNTSDNLDLSVLNHFSDMLKTSSGDSGTAEAMHSVGLLSKLLYQLCDPSVSMRKVHLTACIITHLLKGHFTTLDISRIGLFLVYTLPPAGGSESESCGVSDRVHAEDSTVQTSGPASPVWTRNQLLLSLCDLLTSDDPLTTEQQKALFQTLGRDWFLLFLQAHLHPSTLRHALVLLTHLLARQSQQDGFREGLLPGTLVDGMDEPFVIMDNLRDDSWSYECLSSTCPGFHVLLELLVSQCHLAQVYGALAALLLGTTASTSAGGNLDSVLQSVIDNQADGTVHRLCPEAAAILLELVRIIISRPIPSGKRFSVSDDASWELQFPGSVMQFLCLLHSLRPRDPLWASAEFLHTLAGVVYPLDPLLDPLDPLDASQDGVEAGLTGEEEEEVASTSHPARKQVCDLTSHPARKQVCDFMRILLMDSLLNVPANNNSSHPLVQLLEFSPGEASLEQQQSFQTELLEFLMDIIHMISLENNQNNTHLNPQDCEGQMVILMENVALFSKTLVQRLYSGMLLADPDGLLTFLTDQIVVALEKGQSLKEKTISTLYSCTNKVLLYFLSHPRRSPAEQEVVTRTLRVVVARWDVVMATYNANVVFVTCLLHCLLMIRSGSYSEGFGCEVQKVHTQKILSRLFPLKTPRSASVSHTTHSTTAESELTSLAEACWSKVLTERRHALENHYKIEISANQTGGAGPVGMTDVSPLWEEMSQKAWQIYIESQRSKASGGAVKMAGVISSALRSVQRRLGRESATVKDFLSCMESQRQRGHDMFENMRRNNMQLCSSEWERVSAQWLRVEADLLRERAVFGPGPGVEAPTTRDWVQDAAEGPNRTRPRIRRRALRWSKQVSGSLCLCLRTGASEQNNRSGTEPEAEPRILCEPGTEVNEADETSDCECLTFFPVLSETPASSSTEETPAEHPTSPESCSRRPSCPDLHVILQELQPGEEVVCKMCVVVVSGLRVTEGLVLFGKESLYVCEGFTVNSAGDVCCRKHHPSSVRESSISVSIMLSKEALSASCKRWPYEDIKETRFIRFLLEDNALEIFARNGHSAFLVFLNKDHVSAYKRLCSVVPSLKGRGVAEVIANARKTPVVGKTALNKWQRGEMSNFEYLMHLNTLAGRTYNDLMQYPVFPWVLADYSSENLDLSNASTFRDLSKPMGAQTEKRRAMFLQRYEEVENSAAEEGELSARCHYCTHYSSAIIVASFLVRMEPFSNTFLALQGGLDVPERMFHSVKKEWESASRDNMGDVRELIPEFYYLPDFLLNSNHIPLGSMQDGTTLGDVVLPPWAKGDPQEFIRVHREALESEHVSSHLHQWIDLIFGHRQQGATAVESINTFHPYFYAQKHRGVHDGPTDPLIRSTILGYVSNFGQVPKQLFTKPHPPRSGSKKDGSSPPHHVPFFFRLDKVKPNGQLFKELPKGPVGQILGLEKEMLVLERNRLLLSPLHSCYFGWGFPDNSCAFGNYTTEKTFAVCESPCDWGQTLCAACPDPATVVTGAASGVVCVWDVAISKDKLCHMRLRRPLYGHTEAVTCLAVSDVHSVIVSGSADLTCILWDLDELTYVTQLAGHMTSVTALAINQLSGEIASCAGPLLYLWTMKGQLLSWMDTSCGPQGDILCVAFTQKHEWDARNVIVTGCQDGIIRIWRTEYTRTQLPGPPEEPASPGREHPAQTERRVGGAGCWERHLVLCRELNRSQSTSGRRFKMKPAITALAMSRSHATLLAGDAWGRVYIWTCE